MPEQETGQPPTAESPATPGPSGVPSGTLAEREAAVAQAWKDLDVVMRDLREANAHLVIANLKSQALAAEVGLLFEEATTALDARDAFFEQVSHDLRTPMTSISGWAAILGINPDPPTIAEAARSIATSAAVQARLVNDLLDVSRIMVNKFELAIEELDLSLVADEAVSAIRPVAIAKGTSLTLNVDHSIVMAGDRIRMRQVLDNLLSNAIKFTAAGGAVSTFITLDGDEAVVVMRDDGEGIPADFLPRVFNRHAQATPNHFGGLGVGLAIVKHIVELHGGSVTAESPGEHQGSTFTVRIPGARRE